MFYFYYLNLREDSETVNKHAENLRKCNKQETQREVLLLLPFKFSPPHDTDENK